MPLLYDFKLAPTPRLVRMFIAEKGLDIPTRQIDLRAGEQRSPEFLAVNPRGLVPVLELAEADRICDSTAICYYLEETHPEPPLLGATPRERAETTVWYQLIRSECLGGAAEAVRNGSPMFKGRAHTALPNSEQIPALVERGRARLAAIAAMLDRQLAERPFITGERYTIADIMALVSIDFGARADYTVADELTHLRRWYDEVSARPSAQA